MQRHTIEPRPNWQEEVEKWGMVYHTHDGKPYWFESAYYTLNDDDVARIENATNEVHRLCLDTVKHLVSNDLLESVHIPKQAWNVLEAAWMADAPSLYGRMDFAYDGENPPKLLEYNADTPTALLEAAVVQWQWSQDRFPGSDQFNSIWESLIARWKSISSSLKVKEITFGHDESFEDLMTVSLLRDTADEAGIATRGIHMSEIGWSEAQQRFVDLEEKKIGALFKLYPWEWLLAEGFGQNAIDSYLRHIWIEPLWKLVLSNKAILAVLWERNPGHPNLLPTYLDGPREMYSYAKKPIFSREGANVEIVMDGLEIDARGGDYGKEGFVYQAIAPLPDFEGNRPVIGSWVVGNESCGVGIRETDGWITDDFARFVPHLIRND